jgi:hypothetical protein
MGLKDRGRGVHRFALRSVARMRRCELTSCGPISYKSPDVAQQVHYQGKAPIA